MPFMSDQRREASVDSSISTNSSWTSKGSCSYSYTSGLKSSVKGFFKNRKRKRASPSTSPPPSSPSTLPEITAETTAETASSLESPPKTTNQATKLDQGQEKAPLSIISTCCPRRRRASTRSRELLPPLDFSSSELRKAVVFPRCCRLCKEESVWQPAPEPGFRVSRKARSNEKSFVTTLPLYSAKQNSPLITHKAFTIYFEAQIRSGNDDGEVGLAMGFVAGMAKTSRMPGLEKGSLGIQCRDGKFYLNGRIVEGLTTSEFEKYQQVGIGMTFSRSFNNSPIVTASPSAIDVELFLTRDGRIMKALKFHDQLQQSGIPLFEGFEGAHDLYAAVGTNGEVSVDIYFEQDCHEWKYDLEAR